MCLSSYSTLQSSGLLINLQLNTDSYRIKYTVQHEKVTANDKLPKFYNLIRGRLNAKCEFD